MDNYLLTETLKHHPFYDGISNKSTSLNKNNAKIFLHCKLSLQNYTEKVSQWNFYCSFVSFTYGWYYKKKEILKRFQMIINSVYLTLNIVDKVYQCHLSLDFFFFFYHQICLNEQHFFLIKNIESWCSLSKTLTSKTIIYSSHIYIYSSSTEVCVFKHQQGFSDHVGNENACD